MMAVTYSVSSLPNSQLQVHLRQDFINPRHTLQGGRGAGGKECYHHWGEFRVTGTKRRVRGHPES